MTKTDADTKLEYLETSDEAKAAGLRRIKRRHYTGSLEDLPSESSVKLEVVLDDEVAAYFHRNSNRINSVLRSAMKHEKIARELLDDEEFISGIKEKLAA